DALVRFFRAPQRAFLEQRLGVYLGKGSEALPDREPTRLDALERFRIGDALLHELTELEPALRRRVLRKEGRLPPGALGDVQLAPVERDVDAVLAIASEAEPSEDVPVLLELTSGQRLMGRVTDVYGARRIERIVSKLQPKHQLSTWLRHLAYCASAERPGET